METSSLLFFAASVGCFIGIVTWRKSRHQSQVRSHLEEAEYLQQVRALVEKRDYLQAGKLQVQHGNMEAAYNLFVRGQLEKEASQIASFLGQNQKAAVHAEKAKEFRRAAELYLECEEFESAGRAYAYAGQFQEAVAMFERVPEADLEQQAQVWEQAMLGLFSECDGDPADLSSESQRKIAYAANKAAKAYQKLGLWERAHVISQVCEKGCLTRAVKAKVTGELALSELKSSTREVQKRSPSTPSKGTGTAKGQVHSPTSKSAKKSSSAKESEKRSVAVGGNKKRSAVGGNKKRSAVGENEKRSAVGENKKRSVVGEDKLSNERGLLGREEQDLEEEILDIDAFSFDELDGVESGASELSEVAEAGGCAKTLLESHCGGAGSRVPDIPRFSLSSHPSAVSSSSHWGAGVPDAFGVSENGAVLGTPLQLSRVERVPLSYSGSMNGVPCSSSDDVSRASLSLESDIVGHLAHLSGQVVYVTDAITKMQTQIRQKSDRYILGEKLGEGGMSVVYKATDQKLERIVALKLLLSGLQINEKTLTAFRREAKLLANLDHPNIVVVHDFGVLDGCPYICMEYLEGFTMEQFQIKAGKKGLPLRALFELMNGLFHALEYVHGKNLVHRDIKPANIMYTQHNKVKLMDFGIARSADAHTQSIAGTPAYMSPEQIAGSSIDHRSDLFSLGAMMYHLLTGRLPFSGLARTVKPQSIRKYRDIPSSLEEAVMWCLHRDATRRPQHVLEIRTALGMIHRQLADHFHGYNDQGLSSNANPETSRSEAESHQTFKSLEELATLPQQEYPFSSSERPQSFSPSSQTIDTPAFTFVSSKSSLSSQSINTPVPKFVSSEDFATTPTTPDLGPAGQDSLSSLSSSGLTSHPTVLESSSTTSGVAIPTSRAKWTSYEPTSQ